MEVLDVSLDIKTCIIEFRNKIADLQEVEVEKLLDRFYTVDKSRSDKSIGLSLARVKELIMKMKGNVVADINNGLLV